MIETMPELYKELVDVLDRLSEAYYYQGQLDAAAHLYEANIHLLTVCGPTTEDKARFQVQYGKMLYYQNSLADRDVDAAWTVLLEAKKLAESSTDKACLAKALDLIGMVLYTRAFSNGNFVEPRGYFQRAFELRQQLSDTQGMAESLFHLGLTYQNKDDRTQDDREEALKYYRQAQALAQAGGHKLEESYVVRHLAAEYQEDGDLDRALAGFERSLALREQIGYKVYQPGALLTLGHVYCARQELDQALSCYHRAYDLAEQMDQIVSMVRAQMAMGDAEKERDNVRQAMKHYEIALQVAKVIDYQKGLAAATARIKEID